MPKRPNAYDVSRKRVEELLSNPRCIKDSELSTDFIDAYQLPNGEVLLRTPGEGGVVYVSREEYVALRAELAEYEATLEPPQLGDDSDEFLPQGEVFFTEAVPGRMMDETVHLDEDLSQSSDIYTCTKRSKKTF